MNRNVYIGDKLTGPVFGSSAIFLVKDDDAAKMLEVYDKAQPFESVKIDTVTFVDVISSDACNDSCLIKLNLYNHYPSARNLSLEESQRLRAALEDAEKYLESHR